MVNHPTTRLRTWSRGVVAGLAVLAVIAQLVALYWPVVAIEGPVSWSDKIGHLALFAVPTYAVGLALGRIAPVALAFAIHAPVSELVQHVALPHRSGDPWDVAVDLIGVGLGVLALVGGRSLAARTDRVVVRPDDGPC